MEIPTPLKEKEKEMKMEDRILQIQQEIKQAEKDLNEFTQMYDFELLMLTSSKANLEENKNASQEMIGVTIPPKKISECLQQKEKDSFRKREKLSEKHDKLSKLKSELEKLEKALAALTSPPKPSIVSPITSILVSSSTSTGSRPGSSGSLSSELFCKIL